MKAKGTEEIVYQAVKREELTIDNQGRVWRVKERRGDRWRKVAMAVPCTPRRAENDQGQYLQVRVMTNGVRTYCMASRLVWRHFRGSIPLGLTINHINGKKKDNRPANLELATPSQQTRHARGVLGKMSQRGEKNNAHRLTTEQVREIRKHIPQILLELGTRRSHIMSGLAKQMGVSYQAVWDIVRGRRWASIS